MPDLSKVPLVLEWSHDAEPRPVLRLQVTLDVQGRICGIEFGALDLSTIDAAARAAYQLGRQCAIPLAAAKLAGDRRETP